MVRLSSAEVPCFGYWVEPSIILTTNDCADVLSAQHVFDDQGREYRSDSGGEFAAINYGRSEASDPPGDGIAELYPREPLKLDTFPSYEAARAMLRGECGQ
jgi:hypothetical protein